MLTCSLCSVAASAEQGFSFTGNGNGTGCIFESQKSHLSTRRSNGGVVGVEQTYQTLTDMLGHFYTHY